MNFCGATTGSGALDRAGLLLDAPGAERLRLCLTSADSWKLSVEDGALDNEEVEDSELAGERTWPSIVDDCAGTESKLAGVGKESGPGRGT